MKTNFLVTTAQTIQGAEIVKHIDLVSANVVIGTNVFSDFAASFTDMMGGYSSTYERKLREINQKAIDKLKQNASILGANAIIGLHVDFDEISGKGKSMFMVSALGMAVKVKFNADSESKPDVKEEIYITAEEFENELMKEHITKKLASDSIPNKEEWNYLLDTPLEEHIPLLVNLITSPTYFDPNDVKMFWDNLPIYFSISNKEKLAEALYAALSKNSTRILEYIKVNKLFSAKHILNLIQTKQLKNAIACLEIHKDAYTLSDLKEMNEVTAAFDNLPNLGKIETVKGLLGKEKEKYFCRNQHSNDSTNEFCNMCEENIKGLTRSQVRQINRYKEKIQTLTRLLNADSQKYLQTNR